mmetsp:Transcript_16299/g.24451  ORF Transcript_16299/g.24451 Transcript_16299/m.24451 type:complete len:101 (+) Transcript_16299:20-322(+)
MTWESKLYIQGKRKNSNEENSSKTDGGTDNKSVTTNNYVQGLFEMTKDNKLCSPPSDAEVTKVGLLCDIAQPGWSTRSYDAAPWTLFFDLNVHGTCSSQK